MKRISFNGNIIILVFISAILLQAACKQQNQKRDYLKETEEEKTERMEWWHDATFGIFIHWGVYSVPAGVYKGVPQPGAGEWIMNDAKIPLEEYETYTPQFNPLKFNAKEWVAIAKNAGAKYIVITTKHHDGFCLWDSKVSKYDIIDATPFGRDIIKELSTECRKQGIHFGTYYSIMDWHHSKATPWDAGPNYNQYNYTFKDSTNLIWSDYRENYMKPQLAEIVKKYKSEILWFDGEWILNWTEEQGRDLYNYLRNMNKNLIINNRIGKGRNDMQGMSKYKDAVGDFGTPEQEILETKTDEAWEACMTMNNTWGYKIHDNNWKSSKQLIHNLVDIAAKGGNYLLNVGPNSEGLIPDSSIVRLEEMGKWLKINGEAIYGTSHQRAIFKEGDIYYTTKDEYLYAIPTKLDEKEIILKSVYLKEGSNIRLLGSKEKIEWRNAPNNEGIIIILPENLPSKYACVFKMVAG